MESHQRALVPLAWTEDLLTGNAQIDEQHKRIFQILENLIEAIACRKGREEVGRVLATLSVFVMAHFRLEEALMAEAGFPGLAGHRSAHEAVRVKVETMVDRFHHGDLEPQELVSFLEWWLEDHVEREDQPFSAFLLSMEAKAGSGR
jgi:hemerythrin